MISRIFHAIGAAICGVYLGVLMYCMLWYPNSPFAVGAFTAMSLNILIRLSKPSK